MNINKSFKSTLGACYIGYVTQSIINNFPTLLFLTFQEDYLLSLEQISFLITVNFGTQLLVDLLSAYFVDKIGYRKCLFAAHVLSGVGLLGFGILPELLPSPYAGLIIAYVIAALGSGLIEVLVSPVVEACPTDNKSAHMSLLHSFYSWGIVAVILLSSLYFRIFGIANWRYLSAIWAVLPLANAFLFLAVPLMPLNKEGESMKIREIFSLKIFYLLALMMLCAGACELAIGQWASAYAEAGLNVNKTVGDLAGPCLFALLMGTSRVLSSKLSRKFPLTTLMLISSGLCIIAYLMTSLSPYPLLSLMGCGLCGFSVGIMWPGTYSIGSACCPKAGTALFALLALAGDFGCSAGPFVVGMVSNELGGNLSSGIFAAIVFPILIFLSLLIFGKKLNSKGQDYDKK
ncbi:MAG: MFS transporter [Eubacteriales bacterium]